MIKPLATMFCLVLAVNCVAADDGYKPLLNGKDFDGFNIMQRNATEAESRLIYLYDAAGALHLFRDLPAGTGVNTNKNGTHGILYSEKSYSRYSLKFEYKWGEKLFNNHSSYQYDSGLIYHIKELKIWPTALQYQIRYNNLLKKNHTGDFVAGGLKVQWYTKDGKTFELPSEGGQSQPNRRGQLFAHKNAPHHGLGGQWNACEVIVMSDKWAVHKLNGKVVNMATDLGISEGPIAFEAETAEIIWRNIMIKEFNKDQPIDAFLD